MAADADPESSATLLAGVRDGEAARMLVARGLARLSERMVAHTR
jgi:hypothetical protein